MPLRVNLRDCVECGHRYYRHILAQGPEHAVCMNMTCACPNYVKRDIYAEIKKAGEMGEEAARRDIDAACKGCSHPYTHHDQLGEPGMIFRRPCGEDDCQCDDFGFTIPEEFLTDFEREAQGIAENAGVEPEVEELRVVDTTSVPEMLLSSLDGAMTEELKAAGLQIGLIPDENYQAVRNAYSQGSAIEQLAEREDDGVNHPSHYQGKGPEAIEVARHLSFNLGNALKYIYRAGNKMGENPDKDLAKAIWYINDERALLRGDYDGD